MIKLHGDFLTEKIANLDQEMRQMLDRRMRDAVRSFLISPNMVVVGYGGGDRTIMSFLNTAARAKNCLSEGVWWVSPSPPETRTMHFAAILEEHGKEFHWLQLK